MLIGLESNGFLENARVLGTLYFQFLLYQLHQ